VTRADELVKLDALRKSGVLTQEEFDAEKANLLAGSIPSSTSRSPQPSSAEASASEGSRQESEGEWYAPELHPDVRPPSGPSSLPVDVSTPPPPTAPTQATPNTWTTAPGAEERHSNPTLDNAEFAAEEAKLVEGILVSAVLGSLTTPEVRSRNQTSGAETHDQGMWQTAPAWAPEQPHEQAVTVSPSAYRAPTFASPTFTDTTLLGEAKKSRRRLRLSPLVVAILAAVFFVSTFGTGLVALKQNAVAGQWRQHDQNEVALNHVLSTRNQVLSTRNQVLSTNLVSAHASVISLDSQRTKLDGQVKSLTTQLSVVANAKAKALDQNALLIQLTNEAGTVSNELSTCVDDMDSLITEIDNDLSDLSYNDPYLQSNADTASQVCSTAQQDNQQLQSTLSGSG
jgi:hypothetical protein